MGLDLNVSFIIERSEETMHPYDSVYDEESKSWVHKPTGEVLPKFEIISSGSCNFLKDATFIINSYGDYTSCPKELWDVMGINADLEKKKDNDFGCIAPRREIFKSDLDEEERQILENTKKWEDDYLLYKELLTKATNQENYEITQDNMNSAKEMIDYCKESLQTINSFRSIWDYMEDEDKLHYSYANNKMTKDKLRVVVTYYY